MGKSTVKNALNLEAIIAESKERHPDFEVDGVIFRNVLRLSEEERKAFSATLTTAEGDEAEDAETAAEVLFKALLLVADDTGNAEALMQEVRGNTAVLMTMFSMYQEHTQLGEAQPSQS